MCLCARMLALEWKERAFIEKVICRCFCWFPAAIFVYQNSTQIWRVHTKLYNGAWNVSANNSETVDHMDLRLWQIVYISVFCNISFSWLLPSDGFQFAFLCRVYYVTVKTIGAWRASPALSPVLENFCRFPRPDRPLLGLRRWPMGVSWCSGKFCWWLCLVPRLS